MYTYIFFSPFSLCNQTELCVCFWKPPAAGNSRENMLFSWQWSEGGSQGTPDGVSQEQRKQSPVSPGQSHPTEALAAQKRNSTPTPHQRLAI